MNADLGFLSHKLDEALDVLNDSDVRQSARTTIYGAELSAVIVRLRNLRGAVADTLAARVSGGQRD